MVNEWLNQNAPGYNELNNAEKKVIEDFSMLWSFFEGRVLNYSASARSIQRYILEISEYLLIDDFEIFKEYFTKRYINNGHLNERFQHLNLRGNDFPELVERVLKGETDNISEIVTALLIVVLRYRNNYFHGMKWAYGFQDQHNNLLMANNLLIKLLEINTSLPAEE